MNLIESNDSTPNQLPRQGSRCLWKLSNGIINTYLIMESEDPDMQNLQKWRIGPLFKRIIKVEDKTIIQKNSISYTNHTLKALKTPPTSIGTQAKNRTSRYGYKSIYLQLHRSSTNNVTSFLFSGFQLTY